MSSNFDAATSGDRIAALKVLRDTLARELDTTQSNIHAQLSAQYRGVLEEIAALEADEVVEDQTAGDQLRERREARRNQPRRRTGTQRKSV